MFSPHFMIYAKIGRVNKQSTLVGGGVQVRLDLVHNFF